MATQSSGPVARTTTFISQCWASVPTRSRIGEIFNNNVTSRFPDTSKWPFTGRVTAGLILLVSILAVGRLLYQYFTAPKPEKKADSDPAIKTLEDAEKKEISAITTKAAQAKDKLDKKGTDWANQVKVIDEEVAADIIAVKVKFIDSKTEASCRAIQDKTTASINAVDKKAGNYQAIVGGITKDAGNAMTAIRDNADKEKAALNPVTDPFKAIQDKATVEIEKIKTETATEREAIDKKNAINHDDDVTAAEKTALDRTLLVMQHAAADIDTKADERVTTLEKRLDEVTGKLNVKDANYKPRLEELAQTFQKDRTAVLARAAAAKAALQTSGCTYIKTQADAETKRVTEACAKAKAAVDKGTADSGDALSAIENNAAAKIADIESEAEKITTTFSTSIIKPVSTTTTTTTTATTTTTNTTTTTTTTMTTVPTTVTPVGTGTTG